MNFKTNPNVDLAVHRRVAEDVCGVVYYGVRHGVRAITNEAAFWTGDWVLNWVRGEANHPNLNEFLKSISIEND